MASFLGHLWEFFDLVFGSKWLQEEDEEKVQEQSQLKLSPGQRSFEIGRCRTHLVSSVSLLGWTTTLLDEDFLYPSKILNASL